MAINFPGNRNIGRIHTDGNKRWVWSGKAWDRVTSVDGSTTPTIVQGGSTDTGIDIEYVPITGVTNAAINNSSSTGFSNAAATVFNNFITNASTSLEWDGWLIANVDNTHIYSFEISYDISKFQGNGLVNQSIRGIYVDILTRMDASNTARKAIITAVYPDGTEQVVSSHDPKDGTAIAGSNNFVVCVPVNKGQTNFTLKCEVDASSGTANADEWLSYKIIGAKCVRPVLNNPDKEYVKIDSTVGISALAETGTSDSVDKVYNLSDLRGLGLVTNNIRGIYIRFFGQYLSDSGVTFFATMPDGTVEEISQFDGQTSNGTGVGSNLLLLPINSDQASFTLSATVNNQNATRTWSWKIVGAEQVIPSTASDTSLGIGQSYSLVISHRWYLLKIQATDPGLLQLL